MSKRTLIIIAAAILVLSVTIVCASAFKMQGEGDSQYSGDRSQPTDYSIMVSTAGSDDIYYDDTDMSWIDADPSQISCTVKSSVISKSCDIVEVVIHAPENTCFWYGRHYKLVRINGDKMADLPMVGYFTEEAIQGKDGTIFTADLRKCDFDRAPGRYAVIFEICGKELIAEFEIK